MSREGIVIILGVLVALSPFVGLPYYVLAWVLPILGLVSALIALSLRVRRQKSRTQAPQPTSPVTYEQTPHQ